MKRERKKEIGPSFFARNTILVARELLGKKLQYKQCAGLIVETEAYRDDPASHAVRRPQSAGLLRETFGYVYVFFIYGKYHCLNFTTEEKGVGAVLIRAVEPMEGLEGMKERRKMKDITRLTNGPGKLCEAFGIGMAQSGKPVGEEIRLFHQMEFPPIQKARRIGLSKARELEWRFFIAGNPFVSRHA